MNRIDTRTFFANLASRHLRKGIRPREFAGGTPAKSRRFPDDALRMDVVVRRHGGAAEDGRFSVSGRLPLPGCDIHATAVHADLSTAIAMLTERLVRRSRRHSARSGNRGAA